MKRKSILVLSMLIAFLGIFLNSSYVGKVEKAEALNGQENEISETVSENSQDPNIVNPIQGIKAYTINKYIENDSLNYVIVEAIGEGAWVDELHYSTYPVDLCYIADDGLIVFDGLYVTGEITVEIYRIKSPEMKASLKFVAVDEHLMCHIYDDYENSIYTLKGTLVSAIGNEGVIFDGKDSVFIKTDNPIDPNLINYKVTVSGKKSIEGNEGTILTYKENDLVDNGPTDIEYTPFDSSIFTVEEALTKGGREITGTLKVENCKNQIMDEDVLTVRVWFKNNVKDPRFPTIIYLKPRVPGMLKDLFHAFKDLISYPLETTIYLDFRLRIVVEKPLYLRLDDPSNLQVSKFNPYTKEEVNKNLNSFLNSLKFEGDDAISKDNIGTTSACKANYLKAKGLFDGLTESEIAVFKNLPTLSDARARYASWCRANNEQVPFNSGNETLARNDDIYIAVLAILGATILISFATYYIYRKRKSL